MKTMTNAGRVCGSGRFLFKVIADAETFALARWRWCLWTRVEIKSIPRNGFMAYYKETRSECNESISTALVGVRPNHHLAAYEYTGGQSADRVDASSVAQPFLVFHESSEGFSCLKSLILCRVCFAFPRSLARVVGSPYVFDE